MSEKVKQEIEQRYGPRYAWVMVAIAFIFLGMQFGALVTISVFLKPLVLEFGWSRGIRPSPILLVLLLRGWEAL